MERFEIYIMGKWTLANIYKANSKEEAIKTAIQDVNVSVNNMKRIDFPFEIKILEQHVYHEDE